MAPIVTISAPSYAYVEEWFVVSGILYDSVTGYPITGASVPLYRNGSSLGSATTGIDGDYLKSVKIGTAGVWTLKAKYGTAEKTRTITIEALPPPPPPPPPPPELAATLSASPASGLAPLAVTFTIGISGGVSPYTWSLDPGDGAAPYTGSRSASGSFTQTHTYTKVGTFTATLTVTDALGATALNKATATPEAVSPQASAIGVAAPLIAAAILIKAAHR